MGQALGTVLAGIQLGVASFKVRPQRNIGTFRAQVTMEENHVDDLEITDHPVEQGAVISDHAYKRPYEVTIKCATSNSPGASGFVAGLVGAVTGTAAGVSSILSGAGVSQMKEIYQELVVLQESRQPFAVSTGKREYRDMLIKSLRQDTSKETENSLMLTVVCRQVILVTTQTAVVAAAPASAQADPGSTQPTANKGTKQLAPASSYNAGQGRGFVNPPLAGQ